MTESTHVISVKVCHHCGESLWLVVQVDGDEYVRCASCHTRQAFTLQGPPQGAMYPAGDLTAGRLRTPDAPTYRLLNAAFDRAVLELQTFFTNHPERLI